jgi:RNA polymerase sigma-70 factor (ECF subfamily)
MNKVRADSEIADKFGLSDVSVFVRAHTDWMLAVSYRILQDRGHAEDAVQTAFSKIFAKIGDFEERSDIKSWMHRIVINEALMALRKIKRLQEDPIEDLLPVFDTAGCRIEYGQEPTETPEMLLANAQTHQTIRSAIMDLPDDYRIVLCLRDIEGLTTKEASDFIGISEANVKVRLHRARAALKKLLEPLVKDKLL